MSINGTPPALSLIPKCRVEIPEVILAAQSTVAQSQAVLEDDEGAGARGTFSTRAHLAGLYVRIVV